MRPKEQKQKQTPVENTKANREITEFECKMPHADVFAQEHWAIGMGQFGSGNGGRD